MPGKTRSAVTPTISLVAKEAGVSRATVSRAFSHPDLLTPSTVERVKTVAQRLGYVANQLARALSTGRAGNIALIVPDIANPFFSTLIRGAQARAYQRGYATFLGDSDETPELEDLLLGKLAAQVDGFILTSPRLDQKRIRQHAARTPLVIINRDIGDISRVLVDARLGFRRAVEHLAELGHRTICYVGAPRKSWSNQQRAYAVNEASAGLGLKVVHIDAVRPSHDAGRACVDRVLRSGATGVLAVDDVVAQGLVSGFAERGISVPNDISVVGCDDVIASTFFPSLTTISAHCAMAGSEAVDILLNSFTAKPENPVCKVITGDLVMRSSTGPAVVRARVTKKTQEKTSSQTK